MVDGGSTSPRQPASHHVRQETRECHHYLLGQGHREPSIAVASDPLPVEVRHDMGN